MFCKVESLFLQDKSDSWQGYSLIYGGYVDFVIPIDRLVVVLTKMRTIENKPEMKRLLLLVISVTILISVSRCDSNCGQDKSKLLGYDYCLFYNTPAWELSQAVKKNDSPRIQELVSKNYSLINYQEQTFGKTLLFLTMWHNQIETFKLLVTLGAKVNVHDSYDGASPLIEACKYDINKDFVYILLKNGANPNDTEVGERSKDNQTRYTAVMAATYRGELDLVKELVSLGADINYVNEYGQTALGQAILVHKYDIILYLLQKGADYSTPMYNNVVENRPVYIDEALKKKNPNATIEDSKLLEQILDYLKHKNK
ncbi:MAG TPA: ankyrin repeat domain-containing protein [Prolixibacteraceae bacterium]|jgi:hypothetical protein